MRPWPVSLVALAALVAPAACRSDRDAAPRPPSGPAAADAGPDAPAVSAKRALDAIDEKWVAERVAKMVAVARALPAPGGKDQACPADVLAAIPVEHRVPSPIDWNLLAVLGGDPEPTVPPGGGRVSSVAFQWLDAPHYRLLAHHMQNKMSWIADVREGLETQGPLLAVVRTSERAMPRREEPAAPGGAPRVTGGILVGSVFLVDLRDGKLLCQARVEARSSLALVAGAATTPLALDRDFQATAIKAVKDALARIAPQLP